MAAALPSHLLEVRALGPRYAGSPFAGAYVRGPGGATYTLSRWRSDGLLGVVSACCLETVRMAGDHPEYGAYAMPVCQNCGASDPLASLAVESYPELLKKPALTRPIAEALAGLDHDVLTATLAADVLLAEARLLLACLAASDTADCPTDEARRGWVVAEFERARAEL